ncbi:hypothetical protein Tsubulata_028552, partial [Turnera subulata]
LLFTFQHILSFNLTGTITQNTQFCGRLLAAINNGDWGKVQEFLNVNPTALTAVIDRPGDIPLHAAIRAKQWNIARPLIDLMSEKELELQTAEGSTALHYAGCAQHVGIVECLIRKNKRLVQLGLGNTPGVKFRYAVTYAAIAAHEETTRYIYNRTPIQLLYPECGNDGFWLLSFFLYGEMFDIALDLLQKCPRLGIHVDDIASENTLCPLMFLAKKPSAFYSGCGLGFWSRRIYNCISKQQPVVPTGSGVHISQNSQIEQLNSVALGIKNEQCSCAVRQGFSKWHDLFSRGLCFLGMLYDHIQVYMIAEPRSGTNDFDITLLSPKVNIFLVFFTWQTGFKKIREMKLNHVFTTEILSCFCKEISTGDLSRSKVKQLENLLLIAAANGTKDIIVEILEACPDLIFAADSQGRGLIMTAIVFRQEKIFSLLQGRKYAKFDIIYGSDTNHNNMLHLAGLPPPPQQLSRISGAALQMQRELQWFKEVESLMTTKYVQNTNSNGDTPREAFTKAHKQLRDEGEQWMKQTANSSTVVSALIITIMFTAAFTVPGGNVQETGLPILRRSKTFLIFIISDAISLFSSSTSVLMFLGILTSRYAEDDFLKSLPTKLVIGLSTLFLSIVAMMIAFCATLIIMLHGRLSVIIPVVLLAGVPICLFARLQFPLLVEIFMSTYFGIFSRNKIQEAFILVCNRFVNSWRKLWLRINSI